jgi:hypothetical protein
MAKYRITAPDGRKFVITGGDTPPTQEQIQSLIAGYKEPETKAPVLTPLSDDMKAKPRNDYNRDYWKDFAIGAGQGAVSALGRIASGMTLGGTDWLDRKLGGNLKRLDEDLQRSAEREGLGGLNKVAKFTTELGGNALGLGGKIVGGLAKGSSALAKSNLGKKIGAKALTGLPLVATASGIEGGIQGATASDKLSDLPVNIASGSLFGAVMPVAFKGLGYGIKSIAKPFTPSLMTEGMQGGLSNVVNNPDAVKLLNRGIRQSDDIANDFLLQSRPTARNINKETANMIDDALTSRINVPEAIKNANARYGKYMDVHGADEVFDFTLNKNIPNSNMFGVVAPSETPIEMVNIKETIPNYKKTSDLRNWMYDRFGKMKDVKVSSTNEKVDFSKSGAKRVLKTLRDKQSLLFYPQLDEIISKGQPSGKRLAGAKHIKSVTGQNIYHTGINHDGKPYSFEFYIDQPRGLENRNFAGNKVREIQRRNIDAGSLGHTDTSAFDNYTIADLREVVNNKLPHISSLYDDLTSFQSNRLDDAIKTGFSKTNAKQGSLESMNKVKQELNEQIKKARKVEKPSEVWQLEELKKKLDNSMPEGLKRVDKGYEKAKRLEDAFERGKHYNPNNVDGSDYINELPPFEQNAFTQGLFKRINNNSLSNKNLANTALNYENTLASVLKGDKYDDLIKGLNRQSTRFERLAGLGRKAESKLNTPEAQRFFGREQLESKGSLLGSALDWANSVARGKILTKASKNLLNPYYNGELGAIAKGVSSANTLADYLIKNNPVLGAGLSATAVNNMLNQ